MNLIKSHQKQFGWRLECTFV